MKCVKSSWMSGRENVGQASRISGVAPAAISLLLVYLKKTRQLPERLRLSLPLDLSITFRTSDKT